jgi:hypothetical protein
MRDRSVKFEPRSYRVDFFRHLVNSNGTVFRSRLASVSVPNCTDPDQAARRAIMKFNSKWSLRDWSTLADGYDVVVEDGATKRGFAAHARGQRLD